MNRKQRLENASKAITEALNDPAVWWKNGSLAKSSKKDLLKLRKSINELKHLVENR